MRPNQPPNSILAVLSLDLLIQIVDRLLDPSDRKAVRLVSLAFLRAESLQRRTLNVLQRDALGSLLRRYGSIERLDLFSCAGLDDVALAASVADGGAPMLRQIRLRRASGVGWRGLAAMVAACPKLETVDLSHCVGVGDREAAALAGLPGLKELKLDKCLKVTDVGLAKVAVGCPGLERLGIKWCLEISDVGIELLVKKCRELKELDISYLKVTDKSLQFISTLGKLQVLSMVGCYFVTDEGLRCLNNGNNSLKEINVLRSHNITSSGLVSVIDGHKSLQKLKAGDCFLDLTPLFLSKLGGLTNGFRTLKLDGSQVSVTSLQIIGANCKHLTKIGLGKCNGITDEGVSELVSSCVDLNSIDLTCCRELTDNSLVSIANSCNKLETLLLESCSLITEKGINLIGACCANLEKIDLTDCDVSDTALKGLSKCSGLMFLKLGLCQNVSDIGLAYIGSGCGELRELDLYRCIAVGDEGLAALVTGCKKIKKLNVCYCTQITDQGMKHLSRLEELKEIEIRGLTQVTSLGITAIAIGCRSLAKLDMKHCDSVDDVGFLALTQHSEFLRQMNISDCRISDTGLRKLLSSLRYLQDAKLVHLKYVSKQGWEFALMACSDKLKKVKLLSELRHVVSPFVLRLLQARGCRIRWIHKPMLL
ncbi:LOW QUALITY PROTEIN: F-box/LRR-repeat protein 3-like [Dioscorea cayenensis subsp. rotundata]|uniref:LOW QUALITY PROTEIN: F-box/LRR-repeat protein 3-like n=1 Tax=Dioscorea cayennensis subsp. rotundata TaxID=55577 RepID=A0AB40BJU3_DIOCR|nr:LOW QUALITY PROTEIN: F-box/LRR-repeat protein 3-like [Dioscorea cayenensis subsp. rotundata]